MSEAWIQTATGKKFDILNPTLDMVCIEDIAHSTSQMNRFTGHCKFPYPVAQHEYLGSFIIPEDCQCDSPEEHAFRFLMHDASEGYISDISRPLKHFTAAGEEYRKVEKPIQGLLYRKYGLSEEEPPCVKRIDTMMLYAEKDQLMCNKRFMHQWSIDEKAASVKIVERSFRKNKLLYLDRFNELCRPEDRYTFTFWQKIQLFWYKHSDALDRIDLYHWVLA